jgi:hypothetical protein
MFSSIFATVLAMALSSSASAETATTLELQLKIEKSKESYSSAVTGFSTKFIVDGIEKTMICQNLKGYALDLNQNLYQGWDVNKTPQAGPSFELNMMSCRDSEHEILGWFSRGRQYMSSVSGELLNENYLPVQNPLMMRLRSADNSMKYFKCDSGIFRTKTGETDRVEKFEISESCTPIADLPANKTGHPDFITNHGAYAAISAYREIRLPWAPRTVSKFNEVVDALLEKIPAGTYNGIMTTNAKTCQVTITRGDNKLTVKHVMTATPRRNTQSLELVPEKLHGFATGNVYQNPIQAHSQVRGTMAAGEFRFAEKGSKFFMFEKRADLDGLVLRVDGSNLYCRRLQIAQ